MRLNPHPTQLQQSQLTTNHIHSINPIQSVNPASLYLDNLAPTSRRAMRSLLRNVAEILALHGDLENLSWQELGYPQLAMIRSRLRLQGKSANTINLTLSAVRGVMKSCFHLHMINAEQWLTLLAIKPVRGNRLPSGRSLTNRQVQKLLRVCKKDKSNAGKRDFALLTVMLCTGLRRSEVIALNVEDFDRKTGLLTVQSGKGNKQRQIYVNADNRPAIRHWLNCRSNHDGKLFNPINKGGQIVNKALTGQSIYQIVQKRAAQAQLGELRPHDLRRTFVTRLLEAGVDLNTTRQLAGHSDIKTTARYDLRDQKAQRQAVRRLNF